MIKAEALDNVVMSYLLNFREFSSEECSPFDPDYEECMKNTSKEPNNTTLIETITDNFPKEWRGIITLPSGEQIVYIKYPFNNNTLHYIYIHRDKNGGIKDYESLLVTATGVIKHNFSNMSLMQTTIKLIDLKRKTKEDYTLIL